MWTWYMVTTAFLYSSGNPTARCVKVTFIDAQVSTRNTISVLTSQSGGDKRGFVTKWKGDGINAKKNEKKNALPPLITSHKGQEMVTLTTRLHPPTQSLATVTHFKFTIIMNKSQIRSWHYSQELQFVHIENFEVVGGPFRYKVTCQTIGSQSVHFLSRFQLSSLITSSVIPSIHMDIFPCFLTESKSTLFWYTYAHNYV